MNIVPAAPGVVAVYDSESGNPDDAHHLPVVAWSLYADGSSGSPLVCDQLTGEIRPAAAFQRFSGVRFLLPGEASSLCLRELWRSQSEATA
jgi:hypothetical protein